MPQVVNAYEISVSPLQGFRIFFHETQGVALGYPVKAFQAEMGKTHSNLNTDASGALSQNSRRTPVDGYFQERRIAYQRDCPCGS